MITSNGDITINPAEAIAISNARLQKAFIVLLRTSPNLSLSLPELAIPADAIACDTKRRARPISSHHGTREAPARDRLGPSAAPTLDRTAISSAHPPM